MVDRNGQTRRQAAVEGHNAAQRVPGLLERVHVKGRRAAKAVAKQSNLRRVDGRQVCRSPNRRMVAVEHKFRRRQVLVHQLASCLERRNVVVALAKDVDADGCVTLGCQHFGARHLVPVSLKFQAGPVGSDQDKWLRTAMRLVPVQVRREVRPVDGRRIVHLNPSNMCRSVGPHATLRLNRVEQHVLQEKVDATPRARVGAIAVPARRNVRPGVWCVGVAGHFPREAGRVKVCLEVCNVGLSVVVTAGQDEDASGRRVAVGVNGLT
mmetsp:Transcript_10746/g.34076  ORF Transcript_10746/g.34076 Transcript_10746/m.34076 type:complete len:266 (+) Transcript_10746:600-1397(+)